MAFTETTAVTEVRNIINEGTASYWSDTEIISWIQQGCLDWSEKSLLLVKEDTITLATNTHQYTTSTNSYIDNATKVLSLEYDSKAMQRLTYEQLRGHNAAGLGDDLAPKYFYEQYDGLVFTIYVAPTPSVTYNGGAMTAQLSMRTDDITEIPYEYQQNIFLYAASKCKAKERQWQESALMWQQYVNNIIFSRQDSLETGQEPVESFRIK